MGFVLCDGKWGIVDASMWQISLDDPSDISSHYKTDSLEAVLYEKDGFEFTYYLAALVLSAIPEMRSVWKSRKAAMIIL